MPVLGGDLCSPPSKMSDSKEVSLTITSWIRYKGELPANVVCWILERNAGIPSREAVRTDRPHCVCDASYTLQTWRGPGEPF